MTAARPLLRLPLRWRPRPWAFVAMCLATLASWLALAVPAQAAEDFLEPERAFVFSARPLDARQVEITFDVAPGYYLYREQFRFEATDGATLGTPALPPGKVKFDETFQKDVETHRGTVRIVLPVQQAPANFRLVTTYQGCADAGLCYPPQQTGARVSLAGFGGDGSIAPVDANPDARPRPPLPAVPPRPASRRGSRPCSRAARCGR